MTWGSLSAQDCINLHLDKIFYCFCGSYFHFVIYFPSCRYDADVSAQTADGSSVFFLASGQRNPASLRLLIDEKGIAQSQIDHPNHLKKTPLMNACQKGLFENVKILTEAGVKYFLLCNILLHSLNLGR